MQSISSSFFINPSAKEWTAPNTDGAAQALQFHRSFPGYASTPLIELPEIARELGFKRVLLKDESSRLGLPSFKILGASWGTFRAIAEQSGLPLTSSIETIKDTLQTKPIVLYAATDGNHGRAVARMGAILGIRVEIYVPRGMHPQTIENITSEGAKVTQTNESYDDAVNAAHKAAESEKGILVQDTAFPGYEQIPAWIVEGYSTMMSEIDEQLNHEKIDLVIVPVGVGSLAQAVVTHSKVAGRSTAVLTVEPESAACLRTSLAIGDPKSLDTTPTIMAGLDCGTVSSIAWPVLKHGVDASTTVSDRLAHEATVYLASRDVQAGPCGAAPLAALRALTSQEIHALGLDGNSVVVLLCTEGSRRYVTPIEV